MGSWMPNHRDLYPWGLATSQSVALLFSRVLAAPGAWDVQDLMSMLDSRSWLSFKSWGCPFRPTQVMVLGIWHSSFCWRECHTPFCWKQPLTIRPYENLIRHRQTNQTTQPSAHLHKPSGLANQVWLLAPQNPCRPLAMPWIPYLSPG